MAYLVKPLKGETRKMEFAQIAEAHRNGIVADNWLVRHETQDFWYSVGKLLGHIQSQPVKFMCPNCRGPVDARMIDVDLAVACPKCKTSVLVPDSERLGRLVRDRDEIGGQRSKFFIGLGLLLLGIALTVVSYLYPVGNVFFIFHGLLIAGFAMAAAHAWRWSALKKSVAEIETRLAAVRARASV